MAFASLMAYFFPSRLASLIFYVGLQLLFYCNIFYFASLFNFFSA
nr:MAG TPA: hypothetical protein [Bacteriophage sp.]